VLIKSDEDIRKSYDPTLFDKKLLHDTLFAGRACVCRVEVLEMKRKTARANETANANHVRATGVPCSNGRFHVIVKRNRRASC
jgi:hypothetical protein